MPTAWNHEGDLWLCGWHILKLRLLNLFVQLQFKAVFVVRFAVTYIPADLCNRKTINTVTYP